jgi:CDP-diacylglycerol--serine O-phosphatidyltransferase
MVTSGNLLCGMMALILLFHGRPVPAAWLVFMAVFFDFMDGKVARSLGGGTQFGLEFDSLADVVSFGVVPSMLMYTAYADALGVAGVLASAFFALCGALRLARFNVVHMPGPFQGLPIPAGGLFLSSFILAGVPLHPAAAGILCFAAGTLMISGVPYSSLKGLRKGHGDRRKILLLGGVLAVTFLTLQSAAPLAAMTVYVLSGLVRFDWEKWLSRENPDGESAEKKL